MSWPWRNWSIVNLFNNNLNCRHASRGLFSLFLGLQTEGLFRVPGRPVEIKAIMAGFQKRKWLFYIAFYKFQ